LACQHGVTAVIDCGVAPGMSNIILGYESSLAEIRRFSCLVGGLPVNPKQPWLYKAPFSSRDVIEEYLRPVRYKKAGQVVTAPALSDPKLENFHVVGTLESFNTDGLRTLLTTMAIPDMQEKTLRYPGHLDLVKAFMDSGLFGTDEITMDGAKIQPLDFTAKVLADCWRLEPGEEEFTVMRISMELADGSELTYYLLDFYDRATRTTSMARATGYTATGVARLILSGMFNTAGVIPPEYIGRDMQCFDFLIEHLAEREVIYKRKTQPAI